MTLTALILAGADYLLLLPGFTLLNWIFRPPYYETIDVILFIATLLLIMVLASWGVALNYGVEHLP